MRILLIKPPSINFKGAIKKLLPPLSLGYIAACLEREGHLVKIFDASLEGYEREIDIGSGMIYFGSTEEEIKQQVHSFSPDIVGIHLSLSIYQRCALIVAQWVKEVDKNIRIVLGGVHSTYCSDELIKDKNIDAVIQGEAEISFLEYIKKPQVGIIPPGKIYENLDEIPIPSYRLFNMEGYFKYNLPQNHFPNAERAVSIITSRGCPNFCIFCSSAEFFGHKIRARSVKNIKGEIDYLIYKYNIGEIQFLDDNLTFYRERAYEIFDLLASYGLPWCTPNGISVKTVTKKMLQAMKDSGCYKTTFAIESGNDYVCNKLIKKRINLSHAKEMIKVAKEIGLEIHCYFIIGTPGETLEMMADTFNFIKETQPDSMSMTLATPLPGTELYNICRKNNYLPEGFAFDRLYQRVGNINTKDFNGETLEGLLTEKNRELNEFLVSSSIKAKDKYNKFEERHKEIKGSVFDKI